MTAAAKDARTIHERMSAIQADLPPIGKDQKNQQQGFMFRGHDDVMNALNPLLAKHGVFFLPDVLERVTSQRTTGKGSTMFEVSLLVEFTFYGAAGDSVKGSAWGEGTDMGDKATSKAMTMAFKYWLTQAFAISTTDAADPDKDTPAETVHRGTAAARNTSQAQSSPRATPEALAAYKAEVEAAGFLWEPVLQTIKDNGGTEAALERSRNSFMDAQANLEAQAAV